MDQPRTKLIAILLGATLFMAMGTTFEPEDSRWKRLEAMPQERRQALLAQLEQFEGLPANEQAVIRALDARIAAEPEESRAEYFVAMRRYHQWFGDLTDAQRAEIQSAPADQRLGLVTKRFHEQPPPRQNQPPFFLIADFGSASPFEQARQVRIWLALSDAERETILKVVDANKIARLEALGKRHGVPTIAQPAKEKLERTFTHAMTSRVGPFLKKRYEDTKYAEKKARMVDHYYFLEHPPEKVKAEKLLLFDGALPPWLLATIDRLPPDEARRRLTLLYRLVFPASDEMPEPKSKAAAAKPPAAAPKPASKKIAPSKTNEPF